MNQKHPSGATGLTLANQATVEPHMIRGSNADTKNSKLTVDGDAPSANPFLNLATRSKTGSRKRLLEPLAFFASLATSGVIGTRRRRRLGAAITPPPATAPAAGRAEIVSRFTGHAEL
jgi:hypothetical protein